MYSSEDDFTEMRSSFFYPRPLQGHLSHVVPVWEDNCIVPQSHQGFIYMGVPSAQSNSGLQQCVAVAAQWVSEQAFYL